MRSKALLCLLVGLAYASVDSIQSNEQHYNPNESNNPGWREHQEYEYMVSGRSFSALEDVDRDASGVDIKAKLTIRPRPDGNLLAQITGAQYAQIHSKLGENWKLRMPESQLSFKQMPLSQHPFVIVMKNGVIRDLKVNKDMANWEANFIKAVVSQFQLDTQAQNVINSHINALPQENSQSAVYKTMEDTVTGIQETLYEIKTLPKYILQSRPWLAPLASKGEHIIEIVKNRNHSRATERPLYHYGFDGMGPDYKTSSQTGQFITRATLSEAILSGSLNRYTVQFSSSVDHIMISPTLTDKNHGSVFTFINVTLNSVKPQRGEPQEPANSVSLGSLVYRYGEPFGHSNQARPGKPYHGTSFKYSSEENSSGSSSSSSSSSSGSSEGHSRYPPITRPRRDVAHPGKSNDRSGSSSSSSSSYSSVDSEEYWQQATPKLNEAPESPLLPFTVGYGGNSIKNKFNIVDMVKKMVKEIAKGIQQPEKMQEHNIAGKFVTLSALMRLMNEHEMQQVTAELYHEDQQGQEGAAWATYRDAVAQSGTGPALLTIQEWIKNKKITKDEAAILISTTANAARQPTYEYMRTFFQMLQWPEVMHQSSLNESTLLSFTQLVHEIYVSKSESHNKYPVHSFGAFRNSEGYTFLKKEIIPFLGQQLHQAIQNADTQKIHAYIRALGNVGHQNILQEFEPYLEGEKKCSQFQRLLMILAMDQLAKSDPKVARSVLYKIYQNNNENDQVRVAAVYQMMRTVPSADMLKRMAVFTHIDPNPHVNSAVKSSIESASQLQGADYASLRNAAELARPFLTKKSFGAQFSQNKLRSHVVEQMKLSYKHTFQTYGSDDSFLPDGFKYTLRAKYAGIHQQKINLQAIVSSVDNLINVFQQQTKENRHQTQEKRQQHQQKSQSQGQWSSEQIAQLLGMKVEDAEQLEGYFYLRMGPYQNMLAFDNRTIERLPEFLQEIEESLRQGKTFVYNKLTIEREMAISFPTILGFPFIYTYDTPVVLSINGKAQATATPPMASNGVLSQPENINGEYKVRVTVAAKAQGQVGFITPFDHQRYTAGYDKNFQANIQARGKVQIDIKNMQIETEMQPLESGKDWQLVHYSTWPYTAKNDIFTLQEERRIIQKEVPSQHNYQFGEQWLGAPIRLEVVDAVNVNAAWLYQQFQRQDFMSALLSPWTGEVIQHCQINLYAGLKESSSPKVNIRLGYQNQFQSQNQDSKQQVGDRIKQLYQITEEPLQRQKEFIQRASAGIQNSKTSVVDALIQFHGQQKISYRATVAASKSDVDPNSCFMAHIKKTGGDAKGKHFQVAVTAENHIPNTNGLDLNFAMRVNPTSTYQVRVAAGENYENSDKISAKIQLSKSEERVRHLQEDPLYQQCQHQMREGNLMLPTCDNMTMRANFMDKFNAKVQFDEINPRVRNYTYKAYSHLRYMLYPHIEENLVNATGTNKNEIHIQGSFTSDLHAVNVSIKTEKNHVSFKNVRVGAMGRSIFVPHPVFHLKSRVIGQQLGYQSIRPVCVVDKTAVNTFSHKIYPLSLGSEWTVMLQYVPQRPSQSDNRGQSRNHQLDKETSNYVVLVRQMTSGREVSITMQTPQTNQQSIHVTIKPGSNKQPQVYVNGQEVQYNQQSAAGLYGGFLQIYTLPNNDVKVELKNAFYVISDGKRVKLTVLNGKFRSSVRGLCGTFTGEKETDFMSPQECILRHPQEFVSSYTVMSSNQQIAGGQHSFLQDSQGSHYGSQAGRCYRKEVIPGNYVSNQDAGRVKVTKHNDMCTKHQTRYVVENGEICFTLNPVPVCKKQCQQQGTISKKIPVHCVQQSNVSELWKKQIDKGASPDFSLKSPTKSVTMQVANSCIQ